MVVHEAGPLVVGVDLGGTKILAGVVGPENRILGRGKRSTPAKDGAEAILGMIVETIDEALDLARVSRAQIVALGVGSPGPLDPETGVILFSANLNVRNFALGPDLARVMERRVLVQNDVRVGGYGEFRLGAGRGYRNLIAAFVGTGIGGCLIQDGHVVTGATGNAGELGHIVLKAGGPKCGCGNRGCLESLASKTAISRRISKAIQKGIPTILSEKLAKKSGRLKSGELAAALAASDPVALKEVHRAAHYLGLGVGSLINVFGPEIVLIGGGVTEALGDSFVDLVRVSAHRQALADREGKIRIERAALGDNAGILGAALLARERFLGG